MDGDFDEARRVMAVDEDAFGELGFELLRTASGQFSAQIELAAGDPGEGGADRARVLGLGGSLGDTSFRPTTGAHLATAPGRGGQFDEARGAGGRG